MRQRAWLLAVGLVATVWGATDQDVAEAIKQLGAPDFKVRETATQRLWSAGKAAESALEQATRSTDPEVAQRARRVLADVRLGISPDTPPATRDLIRRYRDGDLEEKQAVITEVVGSPELDYSLLAKLSAVETNATERMQVLGPTVEPVVALIIETAQRDEVDEVAFGALMKSVKLWEALIPEDLTVPLLLLPRLDKWGKKGPADSLFGKALEAQQRLCARSPQNAEAHNNLAWLCAIARRQLAAALPHAQKAVELAPKTPAYLDTLAEIEFQLGHQERALELIKKAVELAPHFSYFHKQLERMQKGDRNSLPPEADEEEGVPDQ